MPTKISISLKYIFKGLISAHIWIHWTDPIFDKFQQNIFKKTVSCSQVRFENVINIHVNVIMMSLYM